MLKTIPAAGSRPRARSPRRLLPSVLLEREDGALRCCVCARRCLLHDDQRGFCTAIENRKGKLYSTAYGVVAEANVTLIESKPVYHFMPGARVLSLGGLGCNLRCRFCQNWEVAFRDASAAGGLLAPNLGPEAAVQLALDQHCAGLGWTYNEPSISPIYARDCARLARSAGLFTVFVTNGLLTYQTLRFLGPWISVYRVDVKSLDAAFYRRIGATDRIGALVPLARRAQQEFNIHVEVVTNLMPGLNESDEQLKRLAGRLVEQLGEDVAWHLTSYVPYAFMRDVPPTPPATLLRARRIGQEAGLRYVYTDSLEAPETANTSCLACGALAVERSLAGTRLVALGPDGRCAQCGVALPIVVPSSS